MTDVKKRPPAANGAVVPIPGETNSDVTFYIIPCDEEWHGQVDVIRAKGIEIYLCNGRHYTIEASVEKFDAVNIGQMTGCSTRGEPVGHRNNVLSRTVIPSRMCVLVDHHSCAFDDPQIYLVHVHSPAQDVATFEASFSAGYDYAEFIALTQSK